MRLYHGATCIVERPLVDRSRGNLDFGKGFYLTSYPRQAESWALRKADFQGTSACVNEYDLDEGKLESYRVLRFDEADESWVEFVCACRRGEPVYRDYDLIVGGVADDKVFLAVDMYYRGLWDMDATLQALRYYDVNDQWCFVTQRALDDALSFSRGWEVGP